MGHSSLHPICGILSLASLCDLVILIAVLECLPFRRYVTCSRHPIYREPSLLSIVMRPSSLHPIYRVPSLLSIVMGPNSLHPIYRKPSLLSIVMGPSSLHSIYRVPSLLSIVMGPNSIHHICIECLPFYR